VYEDFSTIVLTEQIEGLLIMVEHMALKSSLGSVYSPLNVWLLMLIEGWKIAPMFLYRSKSLSKKELAFYLKAVY
jgi:hypothetical protein